MMERRIWEFLAVGHTPVIREWFVEKNISKQDRAKLDYVLGRLRSLDRGVFLPKLLAPVGEKILKLRLRCENRELRPMLCRGPEPACDPWDFTLLQGAIETGGDLYPGNAAVTARENREVLVRNPTWKRIF